MGVYDKEVSEVLGSDAFDYLIEEVKRGIISAQHMKDIAHQLHNHVYGKHLQRLESGTHSAEVEFRDILSDWYNKEMCNLEKQTALQKLVTICTSSSVSLNAVGKGIEKLIKCEDKIKLNNVDLMDKEKVKILVLLGESGTGKSSIGNCLLDLNSGSGFRVSSEPEACTKKPEEIVGFWITNQTQCVIIDTPGLNDSEDQDTEHIKGIVKFLRYKERVNAFLIVRNSQQTRVNRSFSSMLWAFELTFGSNFWQHVIFVVSYASQRDDPEDLQKWKKKIHKNFPESESADLPTVFLDTKVKGSAKFESSAESLWDLVMPMASFDCKDLEAVRTELDQEKEKVKDLLNNNDYLLKKIREMESIHGLDFGVQERLMFG